MSPAELERLRARLTPPRPDPVLPDGFRRAAVLVPIVLGPGGAELILTVRAPGLPHHAGQIAFPGGGALPGETPEATARREAREEVGLDVPEAAILGRLSDLPSPALYLATPVVAALEGPVAPRPDPGEVAEVFAAPLAELRATEPFTTTRLFRGRPRTLHHYPWRGREIWGFTGNVLRELLGLLDGDAAPARPAEARP